MEKFKIPRDDFYYKILAQTSLLKQRILPTKENLAKEALRLKKEDQKSNKE